MRSFSGAGVESKRDGQYWRLAQKWHTSVYMPPANLIGYSNLIYHIGSRHWQTILIIAMDGHNLVDLKTGTGTGGVYISTIPPCAHFLSKKPCFFGRLQSTIRKTVSLQIVSQLSKIERVDDPPSLETMCWVAFWSVWIAFWSVWIAFWSVQIAFWSIRIAFWSVWIAFGLHLFHYACLTLGSGRDTM